MKKLLLLMLLALPAYGQIDLDPWAMYLLKEQYGFITNPFYGPQVVAGPYLWAAGLDSTVALSNAKTLYLEYCQLNIASSSPSSPKGITFEQPDGVIYLTPQISLDGTYNQTLPMDSGRVDVHNTLSLGQHAFTGTNTHDTVSIPGALPTDYYLLTPVITELPAVTSSNDILYAYADTDRLIVIRNSSGSGGLTYTWRRFRQ